MIATRTVPVYTTTDGHDFEDLMDAVRHQAKLDAADSIEAFVAAGDLKDAAATRVRNTLLDYVAFTAQAPAETQAA